MGYDTHIPSSQIILSEIYYTLNMLKSLNIPKQKEILSHVNSYSNRHMQNGQ